MEEALMCASPMRLEGLPRPQNRLKTKRARLPQEITWLELLLMSLRLSSGDLRVMVSKAGALKEGPNGTWWVKRSEISPALWSRWMLGDDKIPHWRLAEMVAVCELIFVIRAKQAEANTRDAMLLRRLLNTAPARFNWFFRQPELREFIQIWRTAIGRRLKMDRHISEMDEDHYQRYMKFLDMVLGEEGEASSDPESKPSAA
jgi:hypothetical protein